MSGYSFFDVQKAIDSVLIGDATLLALLGNGTSSGVVSNPTLSNPSFPYVVLGDASASAWDSATFNGSEVFHTIHVFSQSGDNEECCSILARIYTLLHKQNLTLASNSFVLCLWDDFSTITIEDTEERKTFHGVIRFRILTQ